jgi:hypothetical protein
MKILLDENLPRKLKADFGAEHYVKTVRDMNWLGKRNGELLGLATFNGFDIFITIDRNLRHQQNLDKFNITIFLLYAKNNRRDTLQLLIEKVKGHIQKGPLGKLIKIR